MLAVQRWTRPDNSSPYNHHFAKLGAVVFCDLILDIELFTTWEANNASLFITYILARRIAL